MVQFRGNDLGEFLRTRRAALSPDEAGIAMYGSTRRVPGLRRVEVAKLAGVSASYYARLEQGESHHMSDSVFGAITRALRLSEDERLHLARLAWPEQLTRQDRGAERVGDSLLTLVEGSSGQAAGIIGRYGDILGGNSLYHALFGLRSGDRVNVSRHTFLNPAMRDLLVNWEDLATRIVGFLRVATAELPDDPDLTALITELGANDPDFQRLWSEYRVGECSESTWLFDHPVVGRMTLHGQVLRVPDTLAQRTIYLGAAPGSDSARRLHQLASPDL
ncbi:helix-turn-helix domain-containing protein [Actinoplanes sp. TBRC 11911]|uniref:helix-turn-helix transcriptional regulator n=1 Tax=Actinoplanes sp. TBRC 11911 TaxID=2729386 RepID=UPI00145F3452|nr:helix-turn-helix transcriptional regulator [Actinoplanes sp. TBRC 11911]NMO53388.1 helix-turn-helix domain-containing protein [Actinoplanes sp. TBRC 11911]